MPVLSADLGTVAGGEFFAFVLLVFDVDLPDRFTVGVLTSGLDGASSSSLSAAFFFLPPLALVSSVSSLARFFSEAVDFEDLRFGCGDGSAATSVLRLGGIFTVLISKN